MTKSETTTRTAYITNRGAAGLPLSVGHPAERLVLIDEASDQEVRDGYGCDEESQYVSLVRWADTNGWKIQEPSEQTTESTTAVGESSFFGDAPEPDMVAMGLVPVESGRVRMNWEQDDEDSGRWVFECGSASVPIRWTETLAELGARLSAAL